MLVFKDGLNWNPKQQNISFRLSQIFLGDFLSYFIVFMNFTLRYIGKTVCQDSVSKNGVQENKLNKNLRKQRASNTDK